MDSLRGEVAIVGAADTEVGEAPHLSTTQLYAKVAKLAIEDAGIPSSTPRLYCTACMSDRVHWVTASGQGKVLSFTIVYRPISQAFAAAVPYVVALITLDEGPQMMSQMVGCAPEEVRIGMPVEVVFEDWTEEISMPKFRPLQI